MSFFIVTGQKVIVKGLNFASQKYQRTEISKNGKYKDIDEKMY